MNIYEIFPISSLMSAVYAGVTALSDLLSPVAGTASAALAIIILTLLVRTLLIPVGRSQMLAARTRQRLAPELSELRRIHGSTPEVLQRKTMELYSREQASPFAGCLPVLVQMPILIAVYGLFIVPTVGGHPNELLSHTLFGVPLDTGFMSLVTSGSASPVSTALFLTLMALVAGIAQTSRALLPPVPPPGSQQPDAQNTTPLVRALSFLPFLTTVIVGIAPLAAGLYLLTTTAWTLCERLVLGRIYRDR